MFFSQPQSPAKRGKESPGHNDNTFAGDQGDPSLCIESLRQNHG